MNKLPAEIKGKALKLRRKGYSLKEISSKLDIAQSTASLWLSGVNLNKSAKQRIEKRRMGGRNRVALSWKIKRKNQDKTNEAIAQSVVSNMGKDVIHSKIYCSLLYWCEGGKGDGEGLRFANSDPDLVKTFLYLFRNAFSVNENKLHILMHLHEYHNEVEQKNFWSDLTKIPKDNFYKSFLKAHTAKRIRNNYPGCITIHYNDRRIARQIREIYKFFAKKWARS